MEKLRARSKLVTARGIVPRADLFIGRSGRAGMLVTDGIVEDLLEGSAAIERAMSAHAVEHVELGDAVLLPGLVNAHAHLELTGLKDQVDPGEDFTAWIGGLLRSKSARSEQQLSADALVGLKRAAETGTTAIGDIASTSATEWACGEFDGAPRVRIFREVLDAWNLERTAAALENLAEPLSETERLFEGYSPHAPYTVSAELLHGIALRNRARPRPLAMHWSESDAELEWLESGAGSLAPVLGSSPLRSGLDLLDDAGLLVPSMALVHGNLPAKGEIERIAASGASLVHCPGTHRFFGRSDFPLGEYLDARVPVALGTDSLASNDDLDLVREMRLLWAAEPWLAPEQVFLMGTEGGGRALGLGGRVGCLTPGAFGDWICVAGGSGVRSVLERWLGSF